MKTLLKLAAVSSLAVGALGCLTTPEAKQAPRGQALREDIPLLAIDFLSEFRPKKSGRFGINNLSLENEESDVARFIRARYYKGGASPSASRRVGVKEGGGQFMSTLQNGSVDHLYLRYYVRFADNFRFVKGGKLPGLYGGTRVSGGRIPDGTDGFSTRFMWRTDGMGEAYVYMPSSQQWGTSLGRGSFTFSTGKWECIEQEVKLNTPGALDGVVRVWHNDQLAYENTKLLYRSVPHLKIEGIFFSTFFGGGDPTWAPPEDTHADFARFTTSPTRIGCGLGEENSQ